MGPLFFEETFTVEDNPHLLTEFTGLLEENERVFWFSQTGHTANTTAAFLQEFFGVLIISRGLGHHDHQTSRHLSTSFWWDFLKM
jgi:hypothetical protein